MFKRFDLDVFHDKKLIYHASFSSINHIVKFACGFDDKLCDIEAVDTLFDQVLPIYEMISDFRGNEYGI